MNNEQIEQVISEMIENLRTKIEETRMERIDTYITLPYEKVRIYTMLKFPDFEGLKGKKLNQALQLHLENELELKLEKPIYYYHTYETEQKKWMTVSVVDEKEVSLYPEMLFEKKFNLVKIQLEPDSIREYAIKNQIISSNDTVVLMHFFFDGEEKQVGFYIYKGEFLAAIRYLPMDYYDYSTITNELDLVLKDCEKEIEDFEVGLYCVISEEKSDHDNLKMYLENKKYTFLHEKYPSSKGLLNIVDLEEKRGEFDGQIE
ncbi:hypothetical protein [Bacillus thuringiensis]|uniref:hypothetical protein n=1 Tax=Bacillus thuringiensis TaxID=1428 RepID=UPI0021D662E4|nr:hypothetical protein [Bacillus thuringiensis]MCU7667087.1 hypothetical protein [Bacillus thuringiensis]